LISREFGIYIAKVII